MNGTDAEPLYVLFTMDCLPPNGPPMVLGPPDWQKAERGIRSFADALQAEGLSGTFFVAPEGLSRLAETVKGLREAGMELGVLSHPQLSNYQSYLGSYGYDREREIVQLHKKMWQDRLGEDPLNYERLWRRMFGGDDEAWRKPVTRGEVVRAISAVDTVIWDIIGKKLGTTVHQLLGGFRDEVPCYASGGHYISLGDHGAEMKYIGPEMQRYVDMGFTAVKMRVGRNLREDLERARLVRQIIGPDAHLMMDFNMSGSYSGGVPSTLKQMRALEEVDPYW
ncbi:MAG: enolase C-terminal domain-like protein, partial [Candidatus Brocadiia bacterium]|nr:enolase C-terminal domain-like protein [Candidatus Brocadiia bacterium]